MKFLRFCHTQEAKGDLLIVPICEGDPLSPFIESINQALKGAIQLNLDLDHFSGKKFALSLITTNGLYPIPKLLFVGIGPRSALSSPLLQEIGGFITSSLAAYPQASHILLDGTSLENEDGDVNIPFGMLMKDWHFDKYKRKDHKVPERTLLCLSNAPSQANEKYHDYESLLLGITTARELTSEPANYLYPEIFAERCLQLENEGIEVELFDETQLESMGAHAILAVGAGSNRPPRLVVLKWMGAQDDSPPIALVGKGVCFDSGGINIKTTGEIGDMKWDKAGASIVTGIIQTLAHMKLPVNVVGILGLAENMPDGKSFKPGDIISTLSGNTVEVADTDNEGRLILADCLWYAQQKFAPQAIVDLGTLTLETMGALAGEYAGLFCEDHALTAELLQAGKNSGEKLWQLPMGETFAKQIHSTIADVKNIGILQFGESSASAEFLKCFVKPETAWAHLDIAGVAFFKEETILSTPGVTGFGVRLLVDWIKERYEKKIRS